MQANVTNPTARLYELQVLDLEMDLLSERLAEVEGQLGESDELVAARQALVQQQGLCQDLERRRRELEWQAADLRAKIGSEEEKLYSGRIRNPKELDDLHREVENFKRRYRELEDRQLEVMIEIEEAQAELDVRRQELGRVETEWRSQQERLMAEREDLQHRLTKLRANRAALASNIQASYLELYENLRIQKRGRAVAKVERGMCQGCRIVLPTSELQRLRSSSRPVHCSSCGRILYLS